MLELEVREFLANGASPQGLNSLLQRCMNDGGAEALRHVSCLFEDDYNGMTYKWELKEPAAFALLYWQKAGLEQLARCVAHNPRSSNSSIALDILSSAASGEFSTLLSGPYWGDLKERVTNAGGLAAETQHYARRTLVELVLAAKDEDDLILWLALVFQRHYAKRDGANAAKNLVQAVASRWFAIGDRTLQAYQGLIEAFADDEPRFQRFFEANPQLLDPMAVEVWPQPNLFGSRKPDFVVKRSDGSYLVVEIECPSKVIITKAGHPSADVTHAEHQATDYRKYMLGHIANVKDVFPGFSEPDCLVVVGLEGTLTKGQKAALASLNDARHRLKVVGFDWILDRAKKISENVAEHGVVVSVRRMI
ncbi:Shedu anti-phage system protein SduA domain-containing protein [Paenirhodobacter populi]|nr:Shedu anti-phage system protein SduA domain-containing protein [Sinirhodobacter populi]